MTFQYIIDSSGAIWAQWRFNRDNYNTVLPGCYHLAAKELMYRRRANRPYMIQKRMHRLEGDCFDDSAMCGGGLQ